jgi:hypothetical protein
LDELRARSTGIERENLKNLATPNISACRKIDNVLLMKVIFIS